MLDLNNQDAALSHTEFVWQPLDLFRRLCIYYEAHQTAEQGENERFNTQVISAYRALIKELTPNYVVLNNIISGQNEAGEEVWLVDENDVRIESDLLEN